MFHWGSKAKDPALEPKTIGRYRITRQLGEGGMGVVYAAHDDRLDRSVAIKRIRETSDEAGLRERLVREARAAASISHPNVCDIYELAEDGRELYLVMELLAGEPLADRMARGTVPLAEALQITLGILSALEALHGRGIGHRDLKPSNVFLTPHGGLFTRPFAFIASGEMVVAYFWMHVPRGGFWHWANRGEVVAVYAFVFLFIAAAGAGALSIDGLLQRRRKTATESG
jgi:serine/threonine protein kinase